MYTHVMGKNLNVIGANSFGFKTSAFEFYERTNIWKKKYKSSFISMKKNQYLKMSNNTIDY